jgi:hypothetical protein
MKTGLKLICLTLASITVAHPLCAADLAHPERPSPLSQPHYTLVFSDDFSTDPNRNGQWTVFRRQGDLNHEGRWNSVEEQYDIGEACLSDAACLRRLKPDRLVTTSDPKWKRL